MKAYGRRLSQITLSTLDVTPPHFHPPIVQCGALCCVYYLAISSAHGSSGRFCHFSFTKRPEQQQNKDYICHYYYGKSSSKCY